MANSENNYNICENWGLRCFEQRVNDKGTSVTLRCSMSRKTKNTDQEGKPIYTQPVWIDVICMFADCDIPEDDYSKQFITVDGQFQVDEYTNKENVKVPSLKIWATKVRKYER